MEDETLPPDAPLVPIEDSAESVMHSEGDPILDPPAPEEEPGPEAPPQEASADEKILRRTTITVYTDGRFQINGHVDSDPSGAKGDLEQAIAVINHRFELVLLEQKMRAQAQIMGQLNAEAAAKVEGVRGTIPQNGHFPGPPGAFPGRRRH